jgi:hypothetical protein
VDYASANEVGVNTDSLADGSQRVTRNLNGKSYGGNTKMKVKAHSNKLRKGQARMMD